ncbi:unnamed protein product, partial [Rotaria sordida]
MPIETSTTITPNSTPCSPNPCLNRGKCYKFSNTYVCVCPPEYTGPRCESAYAT